MSLAQSCTLETSYLITVITYRFIGLLLQQQQNLNKIKITP